MCLIAEGANSAPNWGAAHTHKHMILQGVRKQRVLGQLMLDQRGGAALPLPFEPRGTTEAREALGSDLSSNPGSVIYPLGK